MWRTHASAEPTDRRPDCRQLREEGSYKNTVAAPRKDEAGQPKVHKVAAPRKDEAGQPKSAMVKPPPPKTETTSEAGAARGNNFERCTVTF